MSLRPVESDRGFAPQLGRRERAVAQRLARVVAAPCPHPDSAAAAAHARAGEVLASLLAGKPIEPRDASLLGAPWASAALNGWCVERTPEGQYEPVCRYAVTPAGAAIINVPGMLAHGAGLMGLFWGEYDSAVLASALRTAAADPAVRTVALVLDCRGGTVAGSADLDAAADAVQQAGKTIDVLVHEMACSAGYDLIAMADRITVTPTAMVGSIGTIIPRYDWSGLYAEMGIKPKPIATHPRKAQGWAGVPVDDELDDHLRRFVEVERERFFGRVARGRGISVAAVEAMGARVYAGADAVAAGLADRVALAAQWREEMNTGTFAAARSAVRVPAVSVAPGTNRSTTPNTKPSTNPSTAAGGARKDSAMPIDWTTVTDQDLAAMPAETRSKIVSSATPAQSAAPAPATFAELDAAFPTDPGLVRDALKGGLSLSEAKALCAAREAAAKDKELAEMRTRLESAEKTISQLRSLGTAGVGVLPVEAAPASGGAGNAAGQPATYLEAVAMFESQGKNKAEAVKAANERFPELRRQYRDGR